MGLMTCIVAGCDGVTGRPGTARGMCSKHYNRWVRAGNVVPLTDYRVDADAGVVYGRRGDPIGSLDSSGYVQIEMRTNGRRRIVQAHILIWTHVNGPVPPGLEINHKNGIKIDNRISNLELLTHQQNIQHAYDSGLKTNRGMKHPMRKLDETQVREIRKLARDGYAPLTLARRFGVTRRCIYDVLLRKTWSHLED